MPEWTEQEIDEQRLCLIRRIETTRPHGSLRNHITLVFDGRPGPNGSPVSSFIQVIFSDTQSADDYIKGQINRAQNTKQWIVVTNDRDIQYAVRALGAKVMSVQQFLSRLSKSDGRKIKGASSSQRRLARKAKEKIKQELENKWLKPKKQPGSSD